MLDISVVIATYKRPGRLRRLVTSLNNQVTQYCFEVIVVDDGGGVETTGVVESVAPTFDYKVLWQRHAGARRASARNLALKHASGRIVIFLDDDILLPEDLIESHGQAHHGNQNLVLIGLRNSVPFITWQGNLQADHHWFNSFATPDAREWAFQSGSWSDAPWAFVATCHVSCERESLNGIGGFDEGFVGWGFEDTDLGYRLYKSGLRFDFLWQPRVMHFDDEEQSTNPMQITKSRIAAYLENGNRFVLKYLTDPGIYRFVIRHRLQTAFKSRAFLDLINMSTDIVKSYRDALLSAITVPEAEAFSKTTAPAASDAACIDMTTLEGGSFSNLPTVLSLNTPFGSEPSGSEATKSFMADHYVRLASHVLLCNPFQEGDTLAVIDGRSVRNRLGL